MSVPVNVLIQGCSSDVNVSALDGVALGGEIFTAERLAAIVEREREHARAQAEGAFDDGGPRGIGAPSLAACAGCLNHGHACDSCYHGPAIVAAVAQAQHDAPAGDVIDESDPRPPRTCVDCGRRHDGSLGAGRGAIDGRWRCAECNDNHVAARRQAAAWQQAAGFIGGVQRSRESAACPGGRFEDKERCRSRCGMAAYTCYDPRSPTGFERPDPAVRRCDSKYYHACRGQVRVLRFRNADGTLSARTYHFCEVAVDRHAHNAHVMIFVDAPPAASGNVELPRPVAAVARAQAWIQRHRAEPSRAATSLGPARSASTSLIDEGTTAPTRTADGSAIYCEHAPPRALVEATPILLDGNALGAPVVADADRVAAHLVWSHGLAAAWDRHETYRRSRGVDEAGEDEFMGAPALPSSPVDPPPPADVDLFGGRAVRHENRPGEPFGMRCLLCGGWIRRARLGGPKEAR